LQKSVDGFNLIVKDQGKRIGLLLFLLLVCFEKSAFPQSGTDYKNVFGKDWEAALSFVVANESWMKAACEKQNIPCHFAVAIVFPELVRYSALRDKIEISLLKTLYINLGEEYADFSVGPFQIKPSFAEAVQSELRKPAYRKSRNLIKIKIPSGDVKSYRSAIVADLENSRSEFNYLLAFIKICNTIYSKEWKDEYEKLKFYATAYNCGINSIEVIETMSGKKYFTTHLIKTDTYSYSDISLYWYKNFR